MEASIFATMALKNLGVRHVIAKAATDLHGTILARVGADRVVYPEREMGTRVAHSIGIANVIDYLDVAPRFGIVKIRPPASLVGRSLKDLDLPGRLRISPIVLRRGSEVTFNPHRDVVLAEDDELILMGSDDKLEMLER
jgi:trk system potassium uptake protein TrkA